MDIKNLIYRGYSMYPFFREGDILIYRNMNPSITPRLKSRGINKGHTEPPPHIRAINGAVLRRECMNLGSLRTGDIPVVLQEGSAKIYVHRIITVSANRFITKGDNLFHADSEENKILGKVIAINRNGSLNFLTNRKGRLIAILSKYNITPIISNFHAITICRRLKKLFAALYARTAK